MKVKAFLEVLRPYTVIVAESDIRLAQQMNTLADVWMPKMSWNVKDLISRAWPTEPVPDAHEETVKDFRQALLHLHSVVESIAKQDFMKDLSALVSALEPHDRQELAAFIDACRQALDSAEVRAAKKKTSKPVDEQMVTKIVKELKEAYKEAHRFMPLYQRLSMDKSVTQADMAEIATRFAYKTPASTKRDESLRRIGFVHEAYSTSAAKSEFSGGKSAA